MSENRPCGFDRFEPKRLNRFRSFEDIQREMDGESGGYYFIPPIRRRCEAVFQRAGRAGPGDSGLACEAVRAGVLDQKSKNKKEYDGP
jgi:hypothetical protein